MADATENKSFDEVLHDLGPDATATFDNGPSNPTEHASSEATNAATAVEGDDEDLANEDLEDEDDNAAIEEENDEESEGEDVEDQANLS